MPSRRRNRQRPQPLPPPPLPCCHCATCAAALKECRPLPRFLMDKCYHPTLSNKQAISSAFEFLKCTVHRHRHKMLNAGFAASKEVKQARVRITALKLVQKLYDLCRRDRPCLHVAIDLLKDFAHAVGFSIRFQVLPQTWQLSADSWMVIRVGGVRKEHK